MTFSSPLSPLSSPLQLQGSYGSSPRRMAEYNPAEGTCFWFGADWMTFTWLAVGFPCFAIVAFCLLRSWGCSLCTFHRLRLPPRPASAQNDGQDPLNSMYGPLLAPVHVAGSQADVDLVDNSVSMWVQRGAKAAIGYAFFMALIACSHGIQYTGVFEALGSLMLCICKFIVAFCAHKVHCHLSWVARAVAGRWVLVLAFSKFFMGISSLIMGAGYLHSVFIFKFDMDKSTPSDPDFCRLLFIYEWNLFFGLLSQTSAAFALFCIQARARDFVGDGGQLLAEVAGTSWSMLVGTTFGVGAALWLCGLALARGDWDNLGLQMAGCYVLASVSQGLAGNSMLKGNSKIIEYFKTPKGRQAFARAMLMASKMDTTAAPAVIGQVIEVGPRGSGANNPAAGTVEGTVVEMVGGKGMKSVSKGSDLEQCK